MEKITDTLKSAILFALGIAMAAAVGLFALFTIGGLVALGLLAIPVGLVAGWMLREKDDVIDAEAEHIQTA